MSNRLDSAIYQEALAELRDSHLEEFEAIRNRMLTQAGLSTKPNRSMEILTFLQNNPGEHTARQVSKAIKVNAETVRRNANKLAKENKVIVRYEPVKKEFPNTGGRYPTQFYRVVDNETV